MSVFRSEKMWNRTFKRGRPARPLFLRSKTEKIGSGGVKIMILPQKKYGNNALNVKKALTLAAN